MTRVKIKCDTFRRELILESVFGKDDEYVLKAHGFHPVKIQASCLSDAFGMAMMEQSKLVRDHTLSPKRGPRKPKTETQGETVASPATGLANPVSAAIVEDIKKSRNAKAGAASA